MARTENEDRILSAYIAMEEVCFKDMTSLKKYDGFVPLLEDTRFLDGEIFMDETFAALEKNLSFSILCKTKKGDGLVFHSVTETSSAICRKRTGVFVPKVAEYIRCSSNDNWGNFKYTKNSDRLYLQILKNNPQNFRLISPNGYNAQSISNNVEDIVKTLSGFQFWSENGFSAYIKPQGAYIGFTIPIWNLTQLKELFKTRDIPDGKQRRTALRHWVCSHHRRIPSTEDEKILIQQYLRGKYAFDWHGMQVKIIHPLNLKGIKGGNC